MLGKAKMPSKMTMDSIFTRLGWRLQCALGELMSVDGDDWTRDSIQFLQKLTLKRLHAGTRSAESLLGLVM